LFAELQLQERRERTNLYSSKYVGQRLIHAATSSFWRASTSVGSAFEIGRYLKKSAIAA
jgi:hypothetical protein